jgi:hypothetical protein
MEFKKMHIMKNNASKKEGRRNIGSPKLRWLEDVGNDLGELQVKQSWQKASYSPKMDIYCRRGKACMI